MLNILMLKLNLICCIAYELHVLHTLNFSVVAFNLGYLPKGDKSVITEIRSTVQALESVITIVSYVGHQGGRYVLSILCFGEIWERIRNLSKKMVCQYNFVSNREEYEAVRCLASNLPTTHWVCSQREWLNRPLCPRLIVLFKKGETNVSKI